MLLHLLHAKAVRERSINIERLLRDSLLLVERNRSKRTHVVKPVSQFDDKYSNVFCHRHEHLAHGGCLLLFT